MGITVGENAVLSSVKQLSNLLLSKIQDSNEATIDEKIAANFTASQKIIFYIDDIDEVGQLQREMWKISPLL